MTGMANVGLFVLAATAVILFATLIFELLTKYNAWGEIQKGNMAVALALGGIVIGVANIMHFAITTNDRLIDTLKWGGVGTVLLLIVYFAFELLTPKLNINDEIAKGNIAVGFLSFVFSFAFSFIIGASII